MAIINKEKTEVLAKTFAKVHSIENLNDKFLKGRQEPSKIYVSRCTQQGGTRRLG